MRVGALPQHPIGQLGYAGNWSLHGLVHESRLLLFDDKELEAYFSWCVAKKTERGWRIVKMTQTKPVDVPVGLAMALKIANSETGYAAHPDWNTSTHVRSAMAIP